MSEKLEPQELRALLNYDPNTGVLTWNPRGLGAFNSPRAFKSWNTRFAGKVAGYFCSVKGYGGITINGKRYLTHRVCWAVYYGKWPEGQIDHIKGIKTDNRISQLRDVSCQDNRRNMPKPINNKSGVVGVSWFKRDSKWQAGIMIDGKSKYLGAFTDKQDAINARKAAEVKYGFHKNHGRGE